MSIIETNSNPVPRTTSLKEPFEFIGDYCLPTFVKLTHGWDFAKLTLADYLTSPLYTLRILPADRPDEVDTVVEGKCVTSPALWMLPLQLDKMSGHTNSLVHVDAEHVHLDHCLTRSTYAGPVTLPDGQKFYMRLREASREDQFDRELQILCKIRQLGIASKTVRLPVVYGLVVSGTELERTCVGVLTALIDITVRGGALSDERMWHFLDLHAKWKAQVMTTVPALRAHHLVWADVRPSSVMIDDELDAMIVIFGSTNNPEFIDYSNSGTLLGDWQGIERLFQEWLPGKIQRVLTHETRGTG